MRKAISFVLTALMVSSSVLPAFAQKRQAEVLSRKGDVPVTKKQNSQPEATRFADFTAYTDGNGVWLSWQMEAEIGNVGFYAYRVGRNGAELLAPTKGFIPGAATHGREMPSYGQIYSFFDRAGTSDSAYYVEALSLNGAKTATSQIYPEYVPDLRGATGLNREEIQLRGETESAPLENSILTLTKEIANEISETSLVPDPVTHRSVISRPGAVRIGVKTEGIYRVMRSQLEAAGFDVNSDSSLWQLYVDGLEQAILVGPNAAYIEFYGKGTDTPETDIRKYFLITGDVAGKRMGTRVAGPNTTSTVVTPSYLQTFVKKERTRYVDDIINGDAENYFGRGFNSTLSTLNFNLSGIDPTVSTATVRLRFQGYSQTTHAVEVTLNDQLLGTSAGGFGEVPFDVAFTVPTSQLLEGANTIKFRAVGAAADFCFFDTLSIDFSRKFLADQNKLPFYTQNYRIAKLDGFTSANVRVFDLTHDGDPILMTNLAFQQNGSTFGANIPAARGRMFYAVEDSALLAPESVTANNPELVGIPTNAADLVIIAHSNFLAEAQTWANYRIGQGISVKVIEVSELYDEFNYGTFGSSGIRNFLQYAHQNWLNPPEYALLIGDASWDSRNYEGLGNFNFVPPKMVSTVFSDTVSDEALADFNGDGLAEIAIGRISVRTPDQVTTRQGSNVYGNWGSSYVQRGDDWARTAHVTNRATGTRTSGIRTSEGGGMVTRKTDDGRTTIGRTGSGDIYAGHDGNVYRKQDGQWQKWDNGSWNPASKPEQRTKVDRDTINQLDRDRSNRAEGNLRTRDSSNYNRDRGGRNYSGSYRGGGFSGGGFRGGGFRGGGRRR